MIRLLTDEKSAEFFEFCKNDLTGAVITSRLKAYGTNSAEAMFWYAENEDGEMTAACSMFDGVFSACKSRNADTEELTAFAKVVGAEKISENDNCYILKFTGNRKKHDAKDITGENLKDVFPVIFEEHENRAQFFEKWYTDASHKLRHGLIHGKCVYADGKCVSAALTSGETDRLTVISSVATLESYRKKGYGEKVVSSLAESFNKDVYLMTDNEKTMKWYLKTGFSLQIDKFGVFLTIAGKLNQIGITPLLYGSLGLEKRLCTDLSADDIDMLIPREYLGEKWNDILNLMKNMGYELYDSHGHAFRKDNLSVAFAYIESLEDFAGVDLSAIQKTEEDAAEFLLLDLPDYLKVYKASSKDGYRTNKNNRKDFAKIELLESEIDKRLSFECVSRNEELKICLDIIQRSFLSVAEAFSLTKENCPSHTAFITLDMLEKQLTENRLMFLFKYDCVPVGYFSLCNNGDSFELDNLAVLPEFRHCGFGGKMISKAKETVKNLGGRKINIGMIEENEILKKWYESKGFIHMGTKKFAHLPFTVGFMETKTE